MKILVISVVLFCMLTGLCKVQGHEGTQAPTADSGGDSKYDNEDDDDDDSSKEKDSTQNDIKQRTEKKTGSSQGVLFEAGNKAINNTDDNKTPLSNLPETPDQLIQSTSLQQQPSISSSESSLMNYQKEVSGNNSKLDEDFNKSPSTQVIDLTSAGSNDVESSENEQTYNDSINILLSMYPSLRKLPYKTVLNLLEQKLIPQPNRQDFVTSSPERAENSVSDKNAQFVERNSQVSIRQNNSRGNQDRFSSSSVTVFQTNGKNETAGAFVMTKHISNQLTLNSRIGDITESANKDKNGTDLSAERINVLNLKPSTETFNGLRKQEQQQTPLAEESNENSTSTLEEPISEPNTDLSFQNAVEDVWSSDKSTTPEPKFETDIQWADPVVPSSLSSSFASAKNVGKNTNVPLLPALSYPKSDTTKQLNTSSDTWVSVSPTPKTPKISILDTALGISNNLIEKPSLIRPKLPSNQPIQDPQSDRSSMKQKYTKSNPSVDPQKVYSKRVSYVRTVKQEPFYIRLPVYQIHTSKSNAAKHFNHSNGSVYASRTKTFETKSATKRLLKHNNINLNGYFKVNGRESLQSRPAEMKQSLPDGAVTGGPSQNVVVIREKIGGQENIKPNQHNQALTMKPLKTDMRHTILSTGFVSGNSMSELSKGQRMQNPDTSNQQSNLASKSYIEENYVNKPFLDGIGNGQANERSLMGINTPKSVTVVYKVPVATPNQAKATKASFKNHKDVNILWLPRKKYLNQHVDLAGTHGGPFVGAGKLHPNLIF